LLPTRTTIVAFLPLAAQTSKYGLVSLNSSSKKQLQGNQFFCILFILYVPFHQEIKCKNAHGTFSS